MARVDCGNGMFMEDIPGIRFGKSESEEQFNARMKNTESQINAFENELVRAVNRTISEQVTKFYHDAEEAQIIE